jgi:hypothetical protein
VDDRVTTGEPLAPYAAHDEQSRGRRFPEAKPEYRGEFQRDRDRIIHSNAFRRLVYKTQVFVNHEGDLYRTRITHSMEVAQIARSVARALRLNEPLTEAISLAHDLGHTPFGHAGQDALNDCMRPYGGFEHNLQSLRVVDELEERYAEFPGLNLTFECREGILKHCSLRHAQELGDLGVRFIERRQPGLEAQIANLSDEIAYNNHDLDDGIRAQLVDLASLRGPQRLPQNLPHIGLGQVSFEVDMFGRLVGGEGLAAEIDHFALGEGGVFADDEEGDDFAGVFVGLGDGGGFEDAGVGGGDGFDFVGVDVEAGDENHVLFAVFDVDEAVFVHAADVAGAEPTLGQHHLFGLVGAVPVAQHHLRAADADLADFADGEVFAGVIFDGTSVEEMGRPIEPLKSASGGLMQAAGRGFGEAPRLCEDVAAGGLFPTLGDRFLDRHAAAERDLQ